MRLAVATEYLIDRYLLRPKSLPPRIYEQYKLVIALVDVLAPEEVAKMRKGVCPWCGRRFRGKGLVRHLKSSAVWSVKVHPSGGDWFHVTEIYPRIPCRFHYFKLVEYLANAYVKLRSMITKTGPRLVMLKLDGKVYRFKNKGELADAIRNDHEVRRKVVEVLTK